MRSDRGVRMTVAALAAMMSWGAAVHGATAQARDSVSHGGAHAMGWGRATFVLTEVLEYAPAGVERPVLFDVVAWSGGASRRVWFKADGSAATVDRAMHGEFQLLFGRMLSPWWDVQIGARADVRDAPAARATRAGAVIGLQGLAPGWFEVEPTLFVTSRGNISFDLTASHDLYLTQRLVMQPRLESIVALRDEVDFGIGRGLSSASFGLRTRYEVRREFAPYVGVVWERGFGRSAELARLAGESAGQTLIVAGLRVWR